MLPILGDQTELRQVLNDARSRSESPKYLEQPLADLLVTLWMKDGAESSRPDD
jgi:hypothetical protein